MHQWTHQNKKHFCTFCDKFFVSPSGLQNHIDSHTGERSYTCHVCSEAFGTKATLRSHLQSHQKTKLISVQFASQHLPERQIYSFIKNDIWVIKPNRSLASFVGKSSASIASFVITCDVTSQKSLIIVLFAPDRILHSR